MKHSAKQLNTSSKRTAAGQNEIIDFLETFVVYDCKTLSERSGGIFL